MTLGSRVNFCERTLELPLNRKPFLGEQIFISDQPASLTQFYVGRMCSPSQKAAARQYSGRNEQV